MKQNKKFKIVLVLLLMFCLLSFAGCGSDDEPVETPDQSGEAVERIDTETEDNAKAVDAVFDEVLGKYSSFMEMGREKFFNEYSEKIGAYPSDINYMLVADALTNGNDVLWARYDYNGDGTDELVIALGSKEYKQVYAVYTTDGKDYYELCDGQHLGYRVNLYVLTDGNFMIHGSGGATVWEDTICSISEDCKGLDIIEKYVYDESTGNTDYVGAKETLTKEEFEEKYSSKAVDATEYGNVEFQVLTSAKESEPEPDPVEEISYETAFEEIRLGYELCMAGDDGGVGYLRYPEVQWTVENMDEVGGVVYSLYDINSDGTPEMIMGYPEFYTPDSDTNFTVFEIYAFDGKYAVPIRGIFETEFDYINIYSDGTICTHIGNGGDPNEEVYELEAGSAKLNHIGSRNIFEKETKPAEIHFNKVIEKIG